MRSLPRGARARLALLLLLPACLPAPVAAPVRPVPTDSATAMLRRGLAAALQAQGDTAVAWLRAIAPADLDDRTRNLQACMLHRLGDRALPAVTVTDPFVRGVLATYQEYWMRSVRREGSTAGLEGWLRDSLNAQLGTQGAAADTALDGIEEKLQPLLESHGYHALLGVTSPLRELMLWRSERVQRFDVPLPQGIQPVTVVFLDDFASLGWAGFVTCDRSHTGGWTKPDRLYAVASAYDTTSEAFRVSYLAHEGQHFWDTSHLPPSTAQDLLEYRAKLVELAVGRATVYDLLTQFEVNSGQDPAVPHAFANGRVIRDLRTRLFPPGAGVPPWRSVSVERVNAAATALLEEDIARRRLIADP